MLVRQVNRAAHILLALTAAVGLSLFIYNSGLSLRFPHELMWMEGGIFDHVLRIGEGAPIYAAPSWDFVALIYMPLFYYVSAAVHWLTGLELASMRLVSMLAGIGSAILIGRITVLETGRAAAGWIAGIFFLAATEASWFALSTGRVDSLFVLLVLSYYFTANYKRTVNGQLLAAILAIAALYTKQTAIIACAPIALWLLLTQKGPIRFLTPVTAVLGALAILIALQIASNGWFSFYVLELPQGHESQWHKMPAVLLDRLLLQYLFVLLLALLAIVPGKFASLSPSLFAWIAVIALTIAGLLPYAHTGSAPNILLPLQAGMALLLGLCLGSVNRNSVLSLAVTVLAATQFVAVLYNPRNAMPVAAWKERAELYSTCLEKLPQPVLNTKSGYVWRHVNGERNAHESAVADILRAGDRPERTELLEEMERRLSSQYYGALVLGAQMTNDLSGLLEDNYIDAGFSFAENPRVRGAYYVSKIFLSANHVAEHGLPAPPVCGTLATTANQ